MLPLTCCYKHKKNNDRKQKAAHDCGSSILSLPTRCGSVCQEEQTTPKYICFAISSLQPVSILLISFDWLTDHYVTGSWK